VQSGSRCETGRDLHSGGPKLGKTVSPLPPVVSREGRSSFMSRRLSVLQQRKRTAAALEDRTTEISMHYGVPATATNYSNPISYRRPFSYGPSAVF
jgi:hypothetical protein